MELDTTRENGFTGLDGEVDNLTIHDTTFSLQHPTTTTTTTADNLDDDPENMSDESDLSDVDEAQLEDFDYVNIVLDARPAVAVDESNVALLGVHKRKRGDGAADDEGATKKQREGRRTKPKNGRKRKDDDDDDDLSAGEEMPDKRKRKSRSEKKERKKIPEANDEDLSPEDSKLTFDFNGRRGWTY